MTDDKAPGPERCATCNSVELHPCHGLENDNRWAYHAFRPEPERGMLTSNAEAWESGVVHCPPTWPCQKEIASLRSQLAAEREAREKAEGERDEALSHVATIHDDNGGDCSPHDGPGVGTVAGVGAISTSDAVPAPEPYIPWRRSAEMTCGRCCRVHGTSWHAPSPTWNAVMRDGNPSHAERFGGMVCSTCFMQLAQEAGRAPLRFCVSESLGDYCPKCLSGHPPCDAAEERLQVCEEALRNGIKELRHANSNAGTREEVAVSLDAALVREEGK